MIHLRGVGKQFQDRWIFRDVALEVAPKESAVLMGPSGSGKSVLLKMVAGLLKPSHGEITLGSDNVGMLFQKNALFDSLSVEENLLFPLNERKQIKKAAAKDLVRKFLTFVGLDGCEDLFPDEISGGMQKRLGIARALIVEPEIILYDEPTAGLDPITSRLIADLILELKKQVGSTLLTVTNDVQRAYQIGNQIYLLAQGKLIRGGTPDQVARSESPEIKQFIYGLQTGPLTGGLT
ncbi:MAG: ATP-binding cassette domain-containing protein [Bdellovibrio sp.]|nr:ATP-binding cassette domain-containing protein [Bdellovibrio sp.]